VKRVLIAAALALSACDSTSIQGPLLVPHEPAPTLAPRNLPAFFDCLRERGATVVSAHRGRMSDAVPENTLQSFQGTVASVPAFLEIDIARTSDGVLVLMHDDTVDRTTNGHGAVREMTSTEFAALQIDDPPGVRGFEPATLLQALEWADGKTVLELDVTRGVSYEDVAEQVRDAGAMGRVIFITYSVDGASRLARVAPEAMIYTTIRAERDLATLERRGADLTHIVAWLGDEEFSEDLVEALAARGVETRVGMFRRGDDFGGAAHAGVTGVAVNHVDAAFRAIDAADGAEGFAALQCVRG
jgi:glycerophosphoryl diester phosphodiesterase